MSRASALTTASSGSAPATVDVPSLGNAITIRLSHVTTFSFTKPNWYLNGGANDHLTRDLDRLSMHERYTSKDNVQIANGSGLSISHIGHSLLPGPNRPFYLRNILHVLGLSKHLLSIQKLAHHNHAEYELSEPIRSSVHFSY
jgi:hypothetical protein